MEFSGPTARFRGGGVVDEVPLNSRGGGGGS